MTTVTNATALTRANTQPLSVAARPELPRTLSSPAALSSPLARTPPPSFFQDGFSKAGSAVKGWHEGAVKTATDGAKGSGTAFGGVKAAGGLAGGLFGIGSNAAGLVSAIQNGEGAQAIAANILGLTRGTLGAVKGGLDTAAAIESGLAKGASAAAHVAEGAGHAAKLAGRFAPGLNVAMAGVDTAIAARTLADPNASVASKVTSSITAAGSVAAATNIPIVSQVGAAVSTASSLTGVALNHLGDIKDGFNKLGDKLKSLF